MGMSQSGNKNSKLRELFKGRKGVESKEKKMEEVFKLKVGEEECAISEKTNEDGGNQEVGGASGATIIILRIFQVL